MTRGQRHGTTGRGLLRAHARDTADRPRPGAANRRAAGYREPLDGPAPDVNSATKTVFCTRVRRAVRLVWVAVASVVGALSAQAEAGR